METAWMLSTASVDESEEVVGGVVMVMAKVQSEQNCSVSEAQVWRVLLLLSGSGHLEQSTEVWRAA